MLITIGLLISTYTIVRLIQIPLECSGACGVPFAGLNVRIRVWLVTAMSTIGVIGLGILTCMLIADAIEMAKSSAELRNSFDAIERP